MVGRFGWGLLALAASGLVGCATNIVTVPNPQLAAVPQAAAAQPEAQPVVLQLVVVPDDSQARIKADLVGVELAETLAPVATTSLYFETGQASLSPDGKVKLGRVAELLRRYRMLKVRIEGNADERGPAGYNLELGARRALAAKNYLLTVNVLPDQIIIRTNGALKPLAKGHDEASWQINRRNDVHVVEDGGQGESNVVEVRSSKPAAESKVVEVKAPAPAAQKASETETETETESVSETAEEKK